MASLSVGNISSSSVAAPYVTTIAHWLDRRTTEAIASTPVSPWMRQIVRKGRGDTLRTSLESAMVVVGASVSERATACAVRRAEGPRSSAFRGPTLAPTVGRCEAAPEMSDLLATILPRLHFLIGTDL